jgi:LacI family transcriptional regulator
MSVTISDIARHVNVSKATVSRVLNDKPDVDPETANRIRQAIETLGYVRSSRAIALAKGQAYCIGMLVPTLDWPMMMDVLRGVTEVVETSDYGLMLYSMTRGAESIRNFTRQVIGSRQIDGLVVVIPTGMLDYLSHLHEDGFPMILVDDRGLRPSFPSVATTNHEGGYLATRHLLEAGRRRIAMINGQIEFGCNRERQAGYEQALAEAGIEPDGGLIRNSDFTERGGMLQAQALLAAGAQFDGLFVANDLMAFGAMTVLKGAGRRIPGDVAVVGFDDIPAAAQVTPPLTTIRQPFYEMGRVAAGLLLDTLAGRPLPAMPVHLPTELVVRDSTRA